MQKQKRSWMILRNFLLICVFIIGTIAIVGCGGGSGSSSSSSSDDDPIPQNTTIIITGTAAAGAPIVGLVNVKGANGATASAFIEADGSFSIDVSALTAPYILYAEGSVNGRSLSIYSAAVEAGLINITPVTDFILRNALAGAAESAFDNWQNTQVSATDLAIAETNAQSQLQPLLNALAIDSNVNLLNDAFSTDGSGLDAMLDALSISYDGDVATVVNNWSNSSFTDDITSASDGGGFPASDQSFTAVTQADAQAIDNYWASLITFINGLPNDQAKTDWVELYLTDDYLNDGETKDFYLQEWLDEGDEGLSGIEITISIVAPMDVSSLSYEKGYVVALRFTGESDNEYTNMVFDGSNWLEYGNQRWIEFEVGAHALRQVYVSSDYYSTGLEVSTDDDYNYAYDNGVRSAIVTGPGFPAGGLVLEHRFPIPGLGIYGSGWDGGVYFIEDDALIESIPDNAEYSIYYCSEAASVIYSNPASCTVLQNYTSVNSKPPIRKDKLNSSYFASFTVPSSHNIADVNFGGLINVSISVPTGMTPDEEVALYYQAGGTVYFLESEMVGNSAVIDGIGLPQPDQGWTSFYMFVYDVYGRPFNVHWALY